MTINRRRFLARTIAGSAALAVGGMGPFRGFARVRAASSASYGPLRPSGDLSDGVERLALPDGFHYRSFHHAGDTLRDGTVVPGYHDGMGAFDSADGSTVLMRNHEVLTTDGSFGEASTAFDRRAGGGVIGLRVSSDGEVLDDWVGLNGTTTNCNGGVTPWGSWLSCEEAVLGPEVQPYGGGVADTRLRAHGYVFDVPIVGLSDGVPIRAAGRFAHEAAVFSPYTGAVYLTEDNVVCGFYRYTPPSDPHESARLADGGALHMLAVKGEDRAVLTGHLANGAAFPVTWVPIDDPDPSIPVNSTFEAATSAVFRQGEAHGGATFIALEGAVRDGERIWFVSSAGGAPFPPYDVGRGQVWCYDPAAESLTMVFETPDPAKLDLPDNVAIASSGSLLLCEDNGAVSHLRGLTPDGELFDFARNIDERSPTAELAGVTFSPDGTTLFVNVLSESGYTVAINGPWERGGLAAT